MGILQQLYMWILNPIYRITGRLNEKARNIIVFCGLLCMVFQFFMYTAWYGYGISYGYAELFVTNTLLLGIIIVFSINRPLEKVSWNPFVWVPWFLCAALIIISGADHNVTGAFMMFAFLMLLVFPALYFVWNNRGDYHVLYVMTCDAIAIMMVAYFIFHLISSPLDASTAYYGISINPNSNGFIGLAGAISSFYLLCLRRKRAWAYIVILGMAFTLTYISTSRASIIALMLATLAFVICYVRSANKRNMTGLQILIMLVVTCVVILTSITGYRYVLINITPSISAYTADKIVLESYGAESHDAEEYDEEKSLLGEKFTREGDLNAISSGRIVIWKHYMENLNLTGNERGDRGLYIEEKDYYFSAHNSYLEVAYRSGVPAGICYAFIAIYAAVYSFRFLFGKKIFDYRMSLIPMAVLAFGVLSNLERALYPVEKAHIFLFFISLAPMFVNLKNGKRDVNS